MKVRDIKYLLTITYEKKLYLIIWKKNFKMKSNKYNNYSYKLKYILDYLGIEIIGKIYKIAMSYDKWGHFKGMFCKLWSHYDDYYTLGGIFRK